MTDRSIVTPENYAANLAQLWALAKLTESAPLDEMIAAAERADTLGVILDRTIYRSKIVQLQEDLEMLRALRGVKAVLADIARRAAGRASEFAGDARP